MIFSKQNIVWRSFCVGLLACCLTPTAASAQFDLQLSITNPSFFTPNQLAIVEAAVDAAEAVWEAEILGYQPGINQTTLPVTVSGVTTGFGEANGTGRFQAGGFTLHSGGAVRINRNLVEEFSDFRGEGLNIIDDLLVHEIGHVLGIGTLWTHNNVYQFGSGQYTGEFGLAAYRREFDASANFIPVELSGGAGSANAHWDQIFRGGGEAGEAEDPFTLSPLTGILDAEGRDLAGEMLTAALDPDLGNPFLSRFTVESLRDLGFVVRPVPEPSALILLVFVSTSLVARRSRS